jgi:predicted oxidoreductase
MKTIKLGTSGLTVPAVAQGCMRLNSVSAKEAEAAVKGALDLGINFFDHADIYGGGECETIFARAIGMNDSVREKIILQSKCGIIPGQCYDLSKAHILEAVDGILGRLKTDYLDVFLLHRPDILVEPEEVAEAFDILHTSGKVRAFGVSNFKPAQIELLEKYAAEPIVANQMQLSAAFASMLSQGIHVNMEENAACDRDGSVLDWCRLHKVTIECWSPLQFGTFSGPFLGSPQYQALNKKIDELAAKYGVSNTTIAIAWLLRHPANFQVICGSVHPQRMAQCAKACDITLTRTEWYQIFLAAGNTLP